MAEYNLYRTFINDNEFKPLPFIKIKEEPTDIFIVWSIGDRLDKLAGQYYGNTFNAKLLLLANPKYIAETDIEVGDLFRIPFPYDSLVFRLNTEIEKLNSL
jgi:hypothetical protein